MAFCANCGSQVEGRFCQKCGAAVAEAPVGGPAMAGGMAGGAANPGAAPAPMAASAGMTDNMAGALCYLFGLITGILFLVLAPYNQNRTIKFHAFQSIFLNIAWIALWIVVTVIAIALNFIPFLGTFISILLHLALGLGGFILWLYMMFKTYNGDRIVLPVIGPLAEKQAGV